MAAGSKYFEALFSDNSVKDIALHNLDSLAFGKILQVFYKGNITTFITELNDDNVYNLLHASEILQVDTVQNQCILYLTECNVPVKYAVKIFKLGNSIQNKSIMLSASQVILQNSNCITKSSDFPNISFEEMSKLITYFQPTSLRKEYASFMIIFQWVSTCCHKDKRSSFLKLTENIYA